MPLPGLHDFFVIAGTASATLVGLLFVGLSLHLRTVVARLDVRSLARVTLANFALLLLVSLFMVIPQSRTAASADLVGSGTVALLVSTRSLIAVRRPQPRTLRIEQIFMRFGLSAMCYAGTIAAGASLASGNDAAASSALISVTAALLIVSLRNSWDLLVSVGAATLEQR